MSNIEILDAAITDGVITPAADSAAATCTATPVAANWAREVSIGDLIAFFFKAAVALIVVGITLGVPAYFLLDGLGIAVRAAKAAGH